MSPPSEGCNVTATPLLNRLADMDVRLSAAEGRLIVDGPEEILTDQLLATVRHYRSTLLELVAQDYTFPAAAAVRELLSRWPEAQREAFEERAGIIQHLAGLRREEAESEALNQVLDEEVAKIRAAWAAEKQVG
jgi:hypothetical protein